MNKFFYIFYLCPFFISISIFAQEASRPAKQKKVDEQPLLEDLGDDDLEELKKLANAAYHTEPLSAQATNHTSQQSTIFKQSLPRYLSQEKTGVETQPVMVGTKSSKGFAKLVEDDDGDFDPRGTTQQQVTITPPAEQLFEPSSDYAQYTATSPTAHDNNLYPPLEQIAAPQPMAQQQEPVAYGQPICTSRTMQVAAPAMQPPAPSVDHNPYNASSRPVRFNPFEVPQEQITIAQPVTQQQSPEPVATWRTAYTPYTAQQVVQASPIASSTTQQQMPAQQTTLPPEYHTKSIVLDESAKIKKQAHEALVVLLDTLYVRMEDDEVCTNIRKALMAQITRLRKQLPHEPNIDKWFLNLPIDVDGHSIAHLAAANLDPKFLQMLHMMGVDIFRPNRFNTAPEDTAGRYLIEKANLTPAQKKLLLPEDVAQEGSGGKRRVRKSSIASTATSSTSVEEQKKQERYDAQKKLDERERYQKSQKMLYERHKKIIDYFDKVKNKKK